MTDNETQDVPNANPSPHSIVSILRGQGLTVEVDNQHVTIQRGVGLRSQRVAIPAGQIPTSNAEHTASFARGVLAVVGQPPRRKRPELSFSEAAKSISATLEGARFADGVAAANGAEPWTQPYAKDLSIVYTIELSDGAIMVDKDLFASWDVHPERIYKAALSILFHRTRFGDLAPFSDDARIDAFCVGDGFDAGRALILDAWDFPRCRNGAFFSLPHANLLLVTRDAQAESLAALREATARAFDRADAPLSSSIFGYTDGRLVSCAAGQAAPVT